MYTRQIQDGDSYIYMSDLEWRQYVDMSDLGWRQYVDM